jgi:putative DNA methylase
MKNQSQKRRLIEFALPLEAIKKEARARKQKAPKGYPASFHKWWCPKPVSATPAIFLASIIEDPSESPELFPTKEQQSEERNRLLRLIGASICWDKRTASAEREELKRIIKSAVGAESIALVDPFCGSGAIPYAGQEWQAKTIATDLNPVSVVINRCLLQLPFLANGFPGIKGAAGLNLKHEGCHGLSSDIKHYGERLKEILQSKIGHFFSFHPEIKTSEPHASSFSAEKVSAWIWARTVSSPKESLGNGGLSAH